MPALDLRRETGGTYALKMFELIRTYVVLTIMKYFLIPLVAAFMCAGHTLHAEPEIKGTPSELSHYLKGVPRTVNLTGESEVKAAADRATISIRVVTDNKSLQEASRLNQELRTKMIRALTEKNLPADRVNASRFSSTPKYGVFSEKAKSYRVENIVKITTLDEREFQTVANLVDTFPELRYDGIEFDHSDKEGLKRRTLEQALDKATEKKKIYEEKLGVKLSPKGFDEGRIIVPTPTSAARNFYSRKTALTSLPGSSPSAIQAADAGNEEAPSSFDELVFKVVVTVEYSVEAR